MFGTCSIGMMPLRTKNGLKMMSKIDSFDNINSDSGLLSIDSILEVVATLSKILSLQTL